MKSFNAKKKIKLRYFMTKEALDLLAKEPNGRRLGRENIRKTVMKNLADHVEQDAADLVSQGGLFGFQLSRVESVTLVTVLDLLDRTRKDPLRHTACVMTLRQALEDSAREGWSLELQASLRQPVLGHPVAGQA